VYSRSKVDQRIQLAREIYKFFPVYHYPEEIDSFNSNLKLQGKFTYSDAGQISGTTNLSPADCQFILNEQVLCLCDAAYWITRYAYLKSEEGIVQRFRFRVPQRIYFDIICEMEDRDAAIEIMALKARQLGVSIFSELILTHRICFNHGVTAVIGSADQTKTSEMSKMLFLAYDMMPVWLRPAYSSRVESERGKLLFSQLASGVTFQHGSQKFGIATGSTPTQYHLSEVALYGDAANIKLIDEGLWKAVHASDKVLGVLESTGRGDTGWWADTWHYSKNNWPSSRMRPMFLPWYTGVDIYPMPADRISHPIPDNWYPRDETKSHAAKSALYVRANPLIEKHLVGEQIRRGQRSPDDRRSWSMPVDQQWYWEWNHEEAKFKGTESSFYQEMAGDDEEALQRSEEPVFGHDTILAIENSRSRVYETYAISGQSIEKAHDPPSEVIDYDKERIPVRYMSSRQGVQRWDLIPLKFRPFLREDVMEDSRGVLFVWHHPKPGVNYSIGIDTSEGKGLDYTAMEVWSLGSLGQPDVQCAEFASDYVNHVEAFAFALALAAYYGRYMEVGVTRWKEPYVTVEQVAAVGDVCQLQMAKLGYSNFHRMARYDYGPAKIAKYKSSTVGHRGWFSHIWSRPILTGNFVHFVQNGWTKVNSPYLLMEMKKYEVHLTATGKEKFEHSEEGKDDRIMSSAMAVFCPVDTKSIVDRSQRRSIDSISALPPIDLAPYRGHVYTPAQMRETKPITLQDIIYYDANLERFSR